MRVVPAQEVQEVSCPSHSSRLLQGIYINSGRGLPGTISSDQLPLKTPPASGCSTPLLKCSF